jgi:hypothetical protein
MVSWVASQVSFGPTASVQLTQQRWEDLRSCTIKLQFRKLNSILLGGKRPSGKSFVEPPAQPRRDARTDQQADHEHHRRNRHGREHDYDLSGPMLALHPSNDLAKFAGSPWSLDCAVAGLRSEGVRVE